MILKLRNSSDNLGKNKITIPCLGKIDLDKFYDYPFYQMGPWKFNVLKPLGLIEIENYQGLEAILKEISFQEVSLDDWTVKFYPDASNPFPQWYSRNFTGEIRNKKDIFFKPGLYQIKNGDIEITAVREDYYRVQDWVFDKVGDNNTPVIEILNTVALLDAVVGSHEKEFKIDKDFSKRGK